MLTVGSLRPILAAALDEPDARVAPMLEALQCAGLLPADDDAPLDTGDVVTVVFGLLANVPASRVADEVLRLADFRVAGSVSRHDGPGFAICHWYTWPQMQETARELLIGAVNRARAQHDGLGTPHQLRLNRGAEGDCLVLDAHTSGGIDGIFCVSRYATPTRSASALAASIETTLPWLLVGHLAAELGPLPEHNNDNIAELPPTHTATPVWVH